MDYQAVWKVLEEIILEFRKKGVAASQAIMNYLKYAKIMIKITAADESRGETAPKVGQYLGSAETYLVTEAQKKFDPAHIDKWLRRLEEATCEICEKEGKEKEESRFILGVSRDKKWIRLGPQSSLSLEKLKQLAKKTNLSSIIQGDGRLLV